MAEMTGKERMLAALNLKKPDRVPVSSHDILEYYRRKYLNSLGRLEAYKMFGLDAMEYFDPVWLWSHGVGLPTIEQNTENWAVTRRVVGKRRGWALGLDWTLYEEIIRTPGGNLRQLTCEQTDVGGFDPWVIERLIKNKKDIECLQYWSLPSIEYNEIKKTYRRLGNSGILRGQVWGAWAEAALLMGVERLIMETFDDPLWVKELLSLLANRTVEIVKKLNGTKIELLEISETDTSTSLISPRIFEEFVLPYDSKIVQTSQNAGIPTTFHDCGKCMDILELIVATGTNAIETLAPPAINGDADLAEVKQRIGDKVCLIGGIDQANVLERGSPEMVEEEVKRCIEETGKDGGYIMTNADHFFNVPVENIYAYVKAARKYGVLG